MAAPKKRLGRGLGGLIANAAKKETPAPAATPAPKTSAAATPSAPAPRAPAATHVHQQAGLPGFIEIAVSSIVPSPTQARRDIAPEELRQLADSIAAEGLLQPVVVRKRGDKYELIAGERRWRAFQILKLKSIPARLTTASDASAAVLGLIENLQREGLNPIDEAQGYASLINDFKLTTEALIERIGKPRTTIANALRLLGLDAELRGYVSTGRLGVGHAKVLLGVEDAPQRALLARRVIEDGLSVRDTETLVQKHKLAAATAATGKAAAAPGKISPADAAAVASIERKLTSHLGSRVAVRHTAKKGKIIIEYAGNADLQRILEKLGVET